MEQKRLFLLDAYALIYRGYYAFIKNPRINSKGIDTSAIMGFTNSLFELIRKEKPDYIAVVFDSGGSLVRKETFEQYKANRHQTPEPIEIAIPYIKRLLEAMNITVVEIPGFEADDLIGTLAKKAEKKDFKTFMVTPDKDFAQLVSENIFIYKLVKSSSGVEIWGVDQVKKKFEVENPLQVIDYLGMMGDATDNIPGFPSVGDKTAKKFIKEYGSIENLLNHTDELKGKLREKIEANKELGLISKKLARIILDAPVEFKEENFKFNSPEHNRVIALFEELEFRRIIENFKRYFPENEIVKTDRTEKSSKNISIPNVKQLNLFDVNVNHKEISSIFSHGQSTHFYQYLNSDLSKRTLLEKLSTQNSFAFHITVESLSDFKSEIVGIAFSYKKGKSYFMPLTQEEIKLTYHKELEKVFSNPTKEKIGFQIKESIKELNKMGILLSDPFFDIEIAHYLINPDTNHQINVLSEIYLERKISSLESIMGKGKKTLCFSSLSLEQKTSYAGEISDVLFQLKNKMLYQLKENKLHKLYLEVEIPLVSVLAKMEWEGIRLNTTYLSKIGEEIKKEIKKLEDSIYKIVGERFNLASPKQLGTVFFEKLKLVENPKKTKTGQYATSEDILSKLAEKHPVVDSIVQWRSLVKLINTYIDSLPKQIDPRDNRIHTTYSQAVASTGRLSSNKPNLQNIPIRTKTGQQIRKAFIPRNDQYILVSADYSQIELRLIAVFSKDQQMLNSFKNGEDIHKSTAAKIFKIPIEKVTREQRNQAKTVNFGIIYGVSAFGLSRQSSLSRKESQQIIDAYYQSYPLLKKYMSSQIDKAKKDGFVSTILGRKRKLRNINSNNPIVRSSDERNAINAPIQGSSADIIKVAMISIDKLLSQGNYKSKMLLQVHDELVFDMHRDEMHKLFPLIKETMEKAVNLSIALTVDINSGKNWLEAH